MIRLAAPLLGFALIACVSPTGSETVETPYVASIDDVRLPAGVGPEPAQLISLPDGDVRNMLGDPDFVWSESGAAMWRYQGSGCYVDVFLYDGQGVTFVDVHGDDLDERARAACFRAMIKPAAG